MLKMRRAFENAARWHVPISENHFRIRSPLGFVKVSIKDVLRP